MSSYIVDLQGFKLHKNNEFICKEIAVLNIENGDYKSTIFAPPIPWTDLNNKDRRNVQWLTRKYHNLEWCSGHEPYINLETTCQNLLQNNEVDKIYVKGEEKCKWFENIIHKKVINLECLGCPALSELRVPLHVDYCNLHINNCAVRNVKSLYNWYKTRFNMFESFKTFYNNGGILHFMLEEEIARLPQEFVMIYAGKQIQEQWSKFPHSWLTNKQFQQYQCCFEHCSPWDNYEDQAGGSMTLKKDCIMCKENNNYKM